MDNLFGPVPAADPKRPASSGNFTANSAKLIPSTMGSNSDILATNAYRTLGLPTSASQQTIEQAARRMRLRPEPSRIPPTPFDLPWLGPVQRSKNDIEQAIAKLNEPFTRLQERLMWIDCQHPLLSTPSPTEAEALLKQLVYARKASHHDVAILGLYIAITLDKELTQASRWQQLIERFEAVTADGEYEQQLTALEREGDFEKAADSSEIRAASARLDDLMSDVLTSRASAALQSNDLPGCLRIADIAAGGADSVPITGSAMDRCANRIHDLLEDELQNRVEQLRKYFAANVKCDRSEFGVNALGNSAAAIAGAEQYQSTIHPLLGELVRRSSGNPGRTQRVRMIGGRAMALVAVTWIWAAEFVMADDAYSRAFDWVAGTPMEPSMLADRKENAPRAERQRQERANPAKPLLGVGPLRLVKKPNRNQSFRLGFGVRRTKRRWWIAAMVTIGIVQLVNMNSNSSSKTSPHSNSAPPQLYVQSRNGTQSPARFYPAPQPPRVSLPNALKELRSAMAQHPPHRHSPPVFERPSFPSPRPMPHYGGGVHRFVPPSPPHR